MLQRWYELAPRERILVAVCGAFIVFALAWWLLIQPLYKGSARLAEEVAVKQAQLPNFQELAARAGVENGGRTQSASQTSSSDSIVVVIDKTTRQSGLAAYLKRNQPEGDAEVRLRFEDAPFDLLITWLGELNQQNGMVTLSANFDAAGPGRVNCSLVLRRAGL
jgi:general secretion pathway protein M